MVAVEPAALIVLPVAVTAMLRRRWAFLFLLGSVPFLQTGVVHAVSHTFNPPEIALVIITGHVGYSAITERQVVVPNAGPLVLLWGFLAAAFLSVLWAVLNPPAVQVHPYGRPFLQRTFVAAQFGRHNLSQTLLRALFIGGVTGVTLHLSRTDNVRTAVRGVVYGAVLVGLVGIAYQVAILTGLTSLADLLTGSGLGYFPADPPRLQTLPRMYSLPGEPGFTADYLLYALTLTTPLALLPGERWAFSRREALVLTAILGAVLLWSTGTTGYGGLVVFAATWLALMTFFPAARPENPSRVFAISAGGGVVFLTLYVIAGTPGLDVVSYQISKILFQSGSGNIRRYYIVQSLGVIGSRPLLGVGVGSHSAPSFLATLLAETGVVGAAALVGGQLSAFRQSAAIAAPRRAAASRGGIALAVAGATLLVTNLFAKSIFSLLMPWYWFAVALPIAFVAVNTDHHSAVYSGESRSSDRNNIESGDAEAR